MSLTGAQMGLVPYLGIIGWLFAAGGLSLLYRRLKRAKRGSKELACGPSLSKWLALIAVAVFNWGFAFPLTGAAPWVAILAGTLALSAAPGRLILKKCAARRA